MRISEINSKTNFEAIKLARQESNKVRELVRAYRNMGNLEAREQVVEIFTPHIEKEARKKGEEKANLSIKDYTQNLHLKLIEKIEKVNLQHHPVPDIIKHLNEYRAQNDDYIILENNKSLESLTPEEEFFVSHKEQSSLKEKIHTIVSHFIKNERSKGILNDYIDGYTKEELGQKYSLTPNRCVQIIEKNAKFLRLNEKDIERTRTTETVDGNIKHIFKYREFNSGRVGSWLEDTY